MNSVTDSETPAIEKWRKLMKAHPNNVPGVSASNPFTDGVGIYACTIERSSNDPITEGKVELLLNMIYYGVESCEICHSTALPNELTGDHFVKFWIICEV